MAVSWCHCSILLHFWLKFNPSQSLPWALRLVLLSHWRHALTLCCATLSNQIPSLSVKQAKYILDSCSVPPLPFATNSWHLLTRCWESHAWPRSQDETPLFLMSQQILPCPGSRACSPPVSAKGPFPKQKRRWTVNTKPTDGCFHSKLTPSTGELRLLGDMDHTPWLPQSRLLSHSLLATAPSRPCPGDSCSLPAPWCTSWLAKHRHGRISSPKAMVATAAAETSPAAASACCGETGYSSKCWAQGLDHHPMDSSNMSLWHPQQPTPRRSHLSAIFWCICSFCQKN